MRIFLFLSLGLSYTKIFFNRNYASNPYANKTWKDWKINQLLTSKQPNKIKSKRKYLNHKSTGHRMIIGFQLCNNTYFPSHKKRCNFFSLSNLTRHGLDMRTIYDAGRSLGYYSNGITNYSWMFFIVFFFWFFECVSKKNRKKFANCWFFLVVLPCIHTKIIDR